MKEKEKYDWMVCVSCMTYNQAPYIEDAMNGFSMQETSYPFVCAIIDDASTDGEQKVINNYLINNFDLEDKKVVRQEETDDYVLTFARHKTNLNCFFAVFYLKYNHYSIKKSKAPYLSQWRDNAKYYAICEGDDYWIVPDKLQKQVGFMEEHPDFGLCHTNFRCKRGDSLFPTKQRGCEDYASLVLKSGVGTLTVLYRTYLYFDYINDINPSVRGWKMGDAPLWIYMSAKQKVKFFTEVTSVYRILEESASHSKTIDKRINFRRSSYEARKYMLLHLDVPSVNQEYLLRVLYEKNLIIGVVAEYADKGYIKESILFYSRHRKGLFFKTKLSCVFHILYGIMLKILHMIKSAVRNH